MSTLTRENIPNVCRSCLKNVLECREQPFLNEAKQQQPALYHIDRVKDLNKWMAIVNPLEDATHLNKRQRYEYDKYPKFVCRSCYEHFKNVNDFKDMVIHSFNTLTKVLAPYNAEDAKPQSLAQQVLMKTELVIKLKRIDAGDKKFVQKSNTEHTKQQPRELQASIVVPIADDDDINVKTWKKINADNAQYANQQQAQLQESLTQDELIIKSEPIEDDADEEFNEQPNVDEEQFMENDWKMDDEASEVSNDSDVVLLDNNKSLEPTGFAIPLAEPSSAPHPPLNGEEGQPNDAKAYKCPICKINYIHKHSYEAHIRQMHLGISYSFECDVCHKTFTKFSNLNRHMRKKHKLYKCEYNNCSRSFRQLTTRSKHYEQFHNLKPLPNNMENISNGNTLVTCDVCKKVLKLIHIKQHKVTVHEGIKPFACEYCPETFSTNCALKLHTRVHTGEKPYKCSICDIHFTQLASMTKHMTTQIHRKAVKQFKK